MDRLTIGNNELQINICELLIVAHLIRFSPFYSFKNIYFVEKYLSWNILFLYINAEMF